MKETPGKTAPPPGGVATAPSPASSALTVDQRPTRAADVTVVVVSWNSVAWLPRTLRALAAQTSPAARIIVVDNGSGDDSAGMAGRLAADDPWLAGRLEVVPLSENIGFAAANNRAIAMCDTPLVALLNADAFPHERWLERLLDAERRHPEAAAFGSRQMIDGEHDIVDGLGDVCHVSGVSWREGHGRRLRDGDLEEREIFSPCAAAALYRRAALEEVGGFDEDFFCYFEDVDLGFRLRLAGHRCIAVPDAVVDHVGSASSGGRRSDFAVYHGHRNLVWCFVKNMPGPLLFPLLIAHLAQSIITVTLFVIRGQGRPILSAKAHAVLHLPKFLRKRRQVQRTRRVSCGSIWKALARGPWRSSWTAAGAGR
ncbi:MAG: glycosyltransferase family 2 protein [Planctomycetia bacterium]|nr:glycosyltransferase family 2 protein [Planctomycetia bacterium]